MSAPSTNKETIIGISHHFLRTLRNCQNSSIIDNLLTVISKNFLYAFEASIYQVIGGVKAHQNCLV